MRAAKARVETGRGGGEGNTAKLMYSRVLTQAAATAYIDGSSLSVQDGGSSSVPRVKTRDRFYVN